MALGKLMLAEPFRALHQAGDCPQGRFGLLPVECSHILASLSSLPHHHRDPFDRLLIAQAITESMPILGADSALDAYPVARFW